MFVKIDQDHWINIRKFEELEEVGSGDNHRVSVWRKLRPPFEDIPPDHIFTGLAADRISQSIREVHFPSDLPEDPAEPAET